LGNGANIARAVREYTFRRSTGAWRWTIAWTREHLQCKSESDQFCVLQYLLTSDINGRQVRVTIRRLWHRSGGSTITSNQYPGGMSVKQAEADDRGQHQHALLNLANFYYTTGGLKSAKAVCGGL